MKTNKIIEILTEKERESFAFVIKNDKNPRLYLLFDALKKGEKSKAVLFETVFERAHSKKEDYLLRNELRLLNGQLNRFLLKEAKKAELKTAANFEETLLLLRLYLRRQAFYLFEQGWKKAEKQATAAQAWGVLLELVRLRAEGEQLRDELHPAAFADLYQLLDSGRDYIDQAADEQRAELDMLQALTSRYLRILGGEIQAAKTATDFQKNPAVAFYEAIAESHNAKSPAERLAIFLRAQGLEAHVLPLRPRLATAFIALNNNIGLEYFLLRNFAAAAPYFERALALLANRSDYARGGDVRFNAYSNALFAGQYQAAVAFHRDAPDFLADLPQRLYYRFHYLVAVAYLFAGEGATALALLNALPLYQRPNTDYYYARLLFACAYAAVGDWETATRELKNIAQAERKRINPNEQTREAAALLKQWVNFRQSAHSQREQANFEAELHKNAAAKIMDSQKNDSLPMRWLVFHLGQQ